MSWSNYTREAEVGGNGEWPEVPDDLYDARISEISEPRTGPDQFNPGKERTDFYITWELLSGDAEGVFLRQYVTLPEGFIRDGYLSEKSNLYRIMSALGFDMEGRFTVDPPSWVGKRARVMVENRPNKDGDLRPRITDVKPSRRQAPKWQTVDPKKAAQRTRVSSDEWEGEG